MKKLINILILNSIALLIGCGTITTDNIAYSITEKDLFPEGIAYSSLSNSFYVGSVYKNKIIQIDAETRNIKDFTKDDFNSYQILGINIDDKRKFLWTCVSNPEADPIISAIAKFNLKTGDLLKFYPTETEGPYSYNDLTLDKNGNVYLSYRPNHCIQYLDQDTDSITTFYCGLDIELPNGICISDDNKYLYVASATQGIRIIDIESQKIVNEADTSSNSTMIDGLQFYNNSLIGVQGDNLDQSENRICRYYLNESGTGIKRMEEIIKGDPHFDGPTTIAIKDDYVYSLANTQLGKLNPDTKLEDLVDVLILKYKLH